MLSMQPTTNSTGGLSKQRELDKRNTLLYILIVVGATVFLLLIPLVSFIVRRIRQNRRRKRILAQKAQARRQQQMLQQNKAIDSPSSHTNGSAFYMPQKVSRQHIIKPLPRSPINQNGKLEKIIEEKSDISRSPTENGITNKAFESSTSNLSIPFRHSTNDLFLPPDNSLTKAAKRRYSEDLIGSKRSQVVEETPRRFSADISSMTKERENAEDSAVEQDDGNDTLQSKDSSNVISDSESDDYDDVYERSAHDETASNSDSSHIYDNVDNISQGKNIETDSDSDTDHIYRNIDELSDSDSSHIYTNLEETTDDDSGNDADSHVHDDDDVYENVLLHSADKLQDSGKTNDSSDDDSSISYENIDFMEERLVESEDSCGSYTDKNTYIEKQVKRTEKLDYSYENGEPPPVPRKKYQTGMKEYQTGMKNKIIDQANKLKKDEQFV